MVKPYDPDDFCAKCHKQINKVGRGRWVLEYLFCRICSDSFSEIELIRDRIATFEQAIESCELILEWHRPRVADLKNLLAQECHKQFRVIPSAPTEFEPAKTKKPTRKKTLRLRSISGGK